jgi:DNA transformation protein and related proteins
MAKADDEFTSHCLELLSPIGTVRARRMFGGCGIYADDLFVALIADERLYLKADSLTRQRFEAAGCPPFTYDAKGKAMSMGYFAAPDDAMESPQLMQPWARLALEAALRARASKPAPARAKAKAAPAAKAARPRKPPARS